MDGLSETSVLKDKYNVTKRIYRDDFSSIYIVQEVRSKKTYTLKEMFHNVNDSISQTVIRELTRVAEKGVKLDKNPDSPRIVDFFLYKGKSYIVLDYKDEKSIERLMLYPTLGKTLRDRYVTVRGIASGGFGTVYLVRDISLPGKYWAIKEMQNECDQEIIEKSFKIESEMLAKLDHKCIPRIIDSFGEGNRLYLVMDYIKGESLSKLIKKLPEGEYFSEEQIVDWALQICEILYYLHNRTNPIVFRDLKPDNIMINEEGHLKLIDFGIARVFQGTNTATTRYALLTEGYAPQEQFFGKAEPRSDIYALGATMIYLITKINPQKLGPDFPNPATMNPHISNRLANIVLKALEPKLTDRYETIQEMEKDLMDLQKLKETRELEVKHMAKGESYESAGEYLKASFEYMKALELNSNNEKALLGIGRTYENLGLKDKAREHYLKILKSELGSDVKEIIQRKLDALSMEEQVTFVKKTGDDDERTVPLTVVTPPKEIIDTEKTIPNLPQKIGDSEKTFSDMPQKIVDSEKTLPLIFRENQSSQDKTKKTLIASVSRPPEVSGESKKVTKIPVLFMSVIVLIMIPVIAGIFYFIDSARINRLYTTTLSSVMEKRNLSKASENMENLMQQRKNLSPEQLSLLETNWLEWGNLLMKGTRPDLKSVRKILITVKEINVSKKKDLVEAYVDLLNKHIEQKEISLKEVSEILLEVEQLDTKGFDRDLAKIHRIAGKEYGKAKNFEEAKKHLDLSLKLVPENIESLFLMASYYMEKKDYDKTIDLGKKVNNIRGYILLAEAYLAKKDLENAIKFLDKALKSSPGVEEKSKIISYYISVGQNYLVNKKFDKAIDTFTRIMDTDKKNTPANERLAEAYLGKGEEFFEKSLYSDASKYFLKVKSIITKGKIFEKAEVYLAKIEEKTITGSNTGKDYYYGGGYDGGGYDGGGGNTGGGNKDGGGVIDLGTM